MYNHTFSVIFYLILSSVDNIVQIDRVHKHSVYSISTAGFTLLHIILWPEDVEAYVWYNLIGQISFLLVPWQICGQSAAR